MKTRGYFVLPLLSLIAVVLAAPAALALTSYTDVNGTNYDFLNIQEAASSADPEPLFDQPLTDGGNGLQFFPPAFFSSADPGSLFDNTGSQLQMQIMGQTPTDYIDTIIISEFGDTQHIGPGGAGNTTDILMGGFITVLEVDGLPYVGAPGSEVISFTGVFTDNGHWDGLANPGLTIWSGGATIDVASVIPNATKVQVSLDNDLFSFSGGGIATIQKKVVDGPAIEIEVVPEPGTAVLLGLGFTLLGIRGRRQSA